MRKMFDRNNFVLSGLEKRSLIQTLIVMGALVIFFIFSAFTFMNFLYCLSDCIGSIVCSSADVAAKDALRSLPIFLSFFLSLSGLMVAHTFYRNESADILRKRAKKHAAIGAVIGAIIILYVIIMRIAGKYLSLFEGSPSLLYPFDAIIYALFFIVFGILVWMYFAKTNGENYVAPVRMPLSNKTRIVKCIFRTLWLLFALYGFCGFFYSMFIVDFQIGYAFYSIMMMLISFLALMSIAIWELFYNNLKPEKKEELMLPLGIVASGVTIVFVVLYFIALKNNLDGPSNVGFGILPIAFAASVNIATLLVVAVPVIASITTLVKGLIKYLKAKHA